MKKKLSLTLLLIAIMSLCFGMTAFASPKTMSDGTVFDAEYYAKTYPDVAAVFGTDENALYQHYCDFGKAEGRKPAADAQTAAASAAVSTMADNASPVLSQILAAIQDRFTTGTIPYHKVKKISRGMSMNDLARAQGGDWDEIMISHTEDNIGDYMQPILELCSKNGYKYLLGRRDPAEVMKSGAAGSNGIQEWEVCSVRVSNVDADQDRSAPEAVIEIAIYKDTNDYQGPSLYAASSNLEPRAHKVNDIAVVMCYQRGE